MAAYALVIAEDNPKDFEFLRQMVEDWDQECTIEHAPDGQVAFELALAHDQPLVISDIQMPIMNGVDFAKALWDRQPQARIVFWSQFKDEMYVRSLAKIVPPETVYGYVLKSSPRERISAAMATVLFEDQCWIDPEVRKVEGRAAEVTESPMNEETMEMLQALGYMAGQGGVSIEDEDEDVDLDDWGLFQACMSGANVTSDPMCLGY